MATSPNEEVKSQGNVVAESTPTVSTPTHDWSAPKPKAGGYHWGTGRRKSAIARVRIKQGSGKFVINGKEIDDYFRLPRDRNVVTAPLNATDTRKRVDVFVKGKRVKIRIDSIKIFQRQQHSQLLIQRGESQTLRKTANTITGSEVGDRVLTHAQ